MTVGANGSSTIGAAHDDGPQHRRVLAKQRMQETWANYRGRRNTVGEEGPSSPSNTPLPLCSILRGAWIHTAQRFDFLRNNKQKRKKKQQRDDDETRTTTHQPSSFPSVHQMKQASVLAREMEHFSFLQDETSSTQEDQEMTRNDHDRRATQESLAVLSMSLSSTTPQDNSDYYYYQDAIRRLSQSRSRVFLLLDISAMIQAHYRLSMLFPPGIEWQFRVDHNRQPRVLQLMQRLKVGLRCNTILDIQAVQAAASGAQEAMTVVDDAGRTRKPNGYLKRLHRACGVRKFVVDGVCEVERIHDTLTGKGHRAKDVCGDGESNKREASSKLPQLAFILRLTSNVDHDGVMQLVQEIQEVTQRLGHKLLGISISLPATNSQKDSLHVLWQSLQDSILPFLRISTRTVQIDIAQNFPISTLSEEQREFFCNLLKTKDVHITVDASHWLINDAGALCTRIIGVKQEKGSSMRTHYYIDDGCYGSLCRSTEGGTYKPIPLLVRSAPQGGNHEEKVEADDNTRKQGLSTVWGPTCDGLDKVCENVPASLQVHDWLVFPQMGCIGGAGTNFNGFAPPDVAYCVLGYFRRHHEQFTTPV